MNTHIYKKKGVSTVLKEERWVDTPFIIYMYEDYSVKPE